MKDDGTAIISLPNEYFLPNRINFLLGKQLDEHTIDAYGHHSLMTLKNVSKFVESEFKVVSVRHQWVHGKKSKYLKFLKFIKPKWVARNFIFECKK